jgi:hypothetical protein
MILNFDERNVEKLVLTLLDNFISLANHSKGLCVIKKIIQKSKNDFIINKIVNIISENAFSLVHNPFGNYAIQTALEVKLFKILFFLIFLDI